MKAPLVLAAILTLAVFGEARAQSSLGGQTLAPPQASTPRPAAAAPPA
ncbi:MAG: hypothetical protein JWR10_4803, partial [Rubritepida sp.]|nr:hypothetical protein [Rubritepida sp.]